MNTLHFCHIPKTGGLAVRKHLSTNKIPFTCSGHLLRKILLHKDKYIFCVVRNPYDRYVSGVNFFLQKGLPHKSGLDAIFDLDMLASKANYFTPQHMYVDEFRPNYIHKYEDGLESLFSHLYADKAIDRDISTSVEKVNVSQPYCSVADLSPGQRAAIYEAYKDDFRLLGYPA